MWWLDSGISKLIFKSQCSGNCQTKAGGSQCDQVPGNQLVKLERRSWLWMWGRQGQHLQILTAVNSVPTLRRERPGLWSKATSQASLWIDITLVPKEHRRLRLPFHLCWMESVLDKNPNSSKLWGLALWPISLCAALCRGQWRTPVSTDSRLSGQIKIS